jgi:hypothetical protein
LDNYLDPSLSKFIQIPESLRVITPVIDHHGIAKPEKLQERLNGVF